MALAGIHHDFSLPEVFYCKEGGFAAPLADRQSRIGSPPLPRLPSAGGSLNAHDR